MAALQDAALLGKLPDDELFALCRAGGERAWATLVHRSKRLVCAIPIRAGRFEDEVEEIFQDAFVKLTHNIGSISDGPRIRAGLVTTVRHVTILAAA